MSAQPLFAASFHESILDSPGTLTVQGIFPRAWHLRRADDQILTVTCAAYDGPMAVRLDRPSLSDLRVYPGMAARLVGQELVVGPIRIELGNAMRWAPRPGKGAPAVDLHWLRADTDMIVDRVRQAGRGGLAAFYLRGDGCRDEISVASNGGLESARAGRHSGRPLPHSTLPNDAQPAWLVRGIAELAGMADALATGDATAIGTRAFGLLGLGPGLTPSGDDVLCGLLAGLQVLASRLPTPGQNYRVAVMALDGAIARYASSRTTALSATLLHYARRQVALQPLLDVLCTLGTSVDTGGLKRRSRSVGPGRPGGRAGIHSLAVGARPLRRGPYRITGLTSTGTAVEALLDIGHSSGSDMLTGVVLAATAAIQGVTQRVPGWEEAVDSSLACPA